MNELFDFCMDICNKKLVKINGYLPNDKNYVTIPVRRLKRYYKELEYDIKRCRAKFLYLIDNSNNKKNYEQCKEVLATMANNDKQLQLLYRRPIYGQDIEREFYLKLLVDYSISGILAEEKLKKYLEDKYHLTVHEVPEEADWQYHVDLVTYRYVSYDKVLRTGIQVKSVRYLNTKSWTEVQKMNDDGMRRFIDDGLADQCNYIFYEYKRDKDKKGADSYLFTFYYMINGQLVKI